ncbi:MAG: hypothetical protein ACI9VX_001511, partial [Dinoroseobacter sp.]
MGPWQSQGVPKRKERAQGPLFPKSSRLGRLEGQVDAEVSN